MPLRFAHRVGAASASLALVSAALTVLAMPAHAAPSGPYFSEYVEGSSNNKALEIENPTDTAVDLSGWHVAMFFNGSTSPGLTVDLSGTVPAHGVFVLANSAADQPVLDHADQTSGGGWFNGDDAVELLDGATLVDSIGQVGTDPGSYWGGGDVTTQDHTLRRIAAAAPDTDPADAYDPAAEWHGFPKDSFDGLGLPGDETRVPPPPAALPIGTVQGAVGDDADGASFASPYDGQTVTVRGVVTELAEWDSGGRYPYHGFFLQEPDAATDGNPQTSDGIFVFEGTYSDFKNSAGGYFTPQVGDDLTVTAKVDEYFDLTELTGPVLAADNGSVDVAAVITPVTADPPADVADAARYWERIEGMRAALPTGSIADSGRHVYASSHDAEAYFITPDAPVADRDNPYARRVFRDPHPMDDVPGQLFDNGNGYRVLVGSIGVKATADDAYALLEPVHTFQTLAAPAVGGVYYAFGSYSLQPSQQPQLTAGLDPSDNAPPTAPDRSREYSVAQYNLENLYDYRDDPTDGCDFWGNPGCPGAYPPFDYVPESEAAYDSRLDVEATQIINDLHAPDLMTVEEAEAQDICKVDAGQLVCDLVNGTADSDGKPDTLQELALHIAALGGPAYDAAYDPDGADARGIVSGFLYRTDRVQLLPASADDPVLGSDPAVDYRGEALAYDSDVSNPKALNAVLPADVDTSTGVDGDNVFTRAPQVGHFRIWRTAVGASTFVDLYAVANHFSSGPDTRVGQRTEQAAYNAAIAQALAPTGERVLVAGDLNTFPRPDDPLGPTGHSDQLGPLYDAGLHNLYDVLLAEVPASAYSYVFEGQAQTLDQIFVGDQLRTELVQVREAHINADWAADYDGDGPRGASDHDPPVATFAFPASVAALAALVDYEQASGALSDKAASLLTDRLAKAERFLADGQTQAYLSQLQALANQVSGWPATMVTPGAAAALAAEARWLASVTAGREREAGP